MKLIICMSVLGAFLVSMASTTSGSALTPCLPTSLPRYIIESLRISYFDGLHFKPALFMQSKTHRVCQCVLQRWVSLSFCHPRSTSRNSRTSSLCWSKPESSVVKDRRGLAQAKIHLLPLVQAQFTCKSSLFSVLLS